MIKPISKPTDPDSMEPTVPLEMAILILFGVAAGTLIATVALQTWWPSLTASLFGAQAQGYWDLARASGVVAYLLMWLSVALGLIITDRFARLWPGGPVAFDLHQFASLLGLAFALFHGLVLLGDQYIHYTLLQILVPFATSYRGFWVGLGQLALYALVPITFTFYFRRRIGAATWRAIHYGSFITFALITVHGLLSGSDTANPVVLAMYALTGVSVCFLTLYRMLAMVESPVSG